MPLSIENSKVSEMSLRYIERRQKICAARRCQTLIRKIEELNRRYGTEAYIELKEDGQIFSFSTPSYQAQWTNKMVMFCACNQLPLLTLQLSISAPNRQDFGRVDTRLSKLAPNRKEWLKSQIRKMNATIPPPWERRF